MDLSSGLVLKVLGGVGAVSTASLGIVYRENIRKLFSSGHVLTKWDEAIIEKLNKPENITFALSISNGSAATFSSTSDFPNFAEGTEKKTITVSASVSSASNGGLSDVNNKKDWTWECIIDFEKPANVNGTELEEKDKLGKNDTGFFNKLLANTSTPEKIQFVKSCAKARTKEVNEKLSKLKDLETASTVTGQENKKIKSKETFKIAAGTSANKLKITDGESGKFKEFFGFK